MKRNASESTMAISSTGTRKRRKGERKLAKASVSSVDVEVKLTTKLEKTSSRMRAAKKHPRAKPAGTNPKEPTSAMGESDENSDAEPTSPPDMFAKVACPTSNVNALNATVSAAST